MATEWYLAKKEELTEIATAIRNLNGGNAGLKLSDMKNEINTEKSNLEAVKTALKGKGVSVADGATLGQLSELIDGISSDDNVISGTFIPATEGIQTITHNLGRQPVGVMVTCNKNFSDKVNGIYSAFGTANKITALVYYMNKELIMDVNNSIFEFQANYPLANINNVSFQFCLFGLNTTTCMATPIVGEEYRWYVW